MSKKLKWNLSAMFNGRVDKRSRSRPTPTQNLLSNPTETKTESREDAAYVQLLRKRLAHERHSVTHWNGAKVDAEVLDNMDGVSLSHQGLATDPESLFRDESAPLNNSKTAALGTNGQQSPIMEVSTAVSMANLGNAEGLQESGNPNHPSQTRGPSPEGRIRDRDCPNPTSTQVSLSNEFVVKHEMEIDQAADETGEDFYFSDEEVLLLDAFEAEVVQAGLIEL